MRVIAHVDMDAFYTQVEVRRDLDRLAGQPVVVIQYNPFGDLSTQRPEEDRIKPDSNGSIIAVGYEARAFGVKRQMMAQQAKKLCPTLQIVQVPVAHGKADLTIYRDAGAAVINVLSKFAVCERASIDEAYLDVTEAAQQLLASAKKGRTTTNSTSSAAPAAAEGLSPAAAAPSSGGIEQQQEGWLEGLAVPLPDSFEGWHVAGVEPEGPDAVKAWWLRPASDWTPSDALLAAGACIVAHARAAVKAALGFSCSAGIAHSKILAKLGSGLHKPSQQTVVPADAVAGLLAPLPVAKLRQLGGKFGEEIVTKLGVTTVGELAALPVQRLEAVLGTQDAAWLHRLAQGLDGENVKPRKLPQSISCGKTFRGHNVLTGLTSVHTWLLQLAQELQERIETDRQQHQRLPKLLTVSFDSAPVEDAAAAAAAVGGKSSGRSNSSSGSEGGPVHARMTAQNWRAGATNISRSCALRHARADAIAADALGLVKKWARDRPNGFRIVTMFISASNFSLAPTGASTLDRFFAASAAAAGASAGGSTAATAGGTEAAAVATTAAGGAVGSVQHADMLEPQQQQQREAGMPAGTLQCHPGIDSSAPAQLSGSKRAAASIPPYGRHKKAVRVQQQQGSLRAFLASNQATDSSAAAATTAAASSVAVAPTEDASAAAAHADGDDSEEQLLDVLVIESSQDVFKGDADDVEVVRDMNGGVAAAAGATAAADDPGTSAAAAAAAAAISSEPSAGMAASVDTLQAPVATRVSPVRPAVSALQALSRQPFVFAAVPAVSSGQSAAAGATEQPHAAGVPLWEPDHALTPAAAVESEQQQGACSDAGHAMPQLQQTQDGSQHTQEAQPSLQGWLGGQQPGAAHSTQLQAQPAAQQEPQIGQLQPQQSVALQGATDSIQLSALSASQQELQISRQQQQETVAQQEELLSSSKQPGDVQIQGGPQLQQQQQQPLQKRPGYDAQGPNVQQQGQHAQESEQAQLGQQQHVQQQHSRKQAGAAAHSLPVQPARLSDIDPEVLAALPWDIQVEVRSQLRASRGSLQTGSSSGRRGGGGRAGSAGGRGQQQHGSIFKYLKR